MEGRVRQQETAMMEDGPVAGTLETGIKLTWSPTQELECKFLCLL